MFYWKKLYLLIIIILLIVVKLKLYILNINPTIDNSNIVSDFKRYDCKSMSRYGSNSNRDPLYRIDGKKFYLVIVNHFFIES